MRTCNRCDVEKDISEFYDRYYRCKKCISTIRMVKTSVKRNSDMFRDLIVMEAKNCSRCGEYKSFNEFSKAHNKAKYGYRSECKDCGKKEHDAFIENNPHYNNEYDKKRKSEDPIYKLAHNIRIRMWQVLKGISKSNSTIKLLGCTPEKLRTYLQERFEGGMNWDNYGEFWEVDHKIPCASFDLTDPEQQKECFHYSNLQPLTVTDNRKKKDKII